jgi:hypothetical protein
LAKFIQHTVAEETISQFKVQGQSLAEEFVAFVRDQVTDEVDVDEEEQQDQVDLLKRIKHACDGQKDT